MGQFSRYLFIFALGSMALTALTISVGFAYGALIIVKEKNPSLKTVVLLRPDKEEGHFWDHFEAASKAAAQDLDINLQIIRSYSDPFELVQNAKKVAQSPQKPDLVIFRLQDNVGQQILNIFERAEINSFVINTGFSDAFSKKAGQPREKYKHWIGQITPNDKKAGYDLMETLNTRAKSKGLKDKRSTHVIGISGQHGTRSNKDRLQGFFSYLETRTHLNFQGMVAGYWEEKPATIVARRLLQKHSDTHVIWAINDNVAIGAVKAAKSLGLKPGEDILIAGIDWVPDVFDYIRRGEIEATIGGHMMEGAFALILAYDYNNGYDYAKNIGTVIRSPMEIIDRSNVDKLGTRIESLNFDDIDFKALTKTHNKSLKEYDFSFTHILNHYTPRE